MAIALLHQEKYKQEKQVLLLRAHYVVETVHVTFYQVKEQLKKHNTETHWKSQPTRYHT